MDKATAANQVANANMSTYDIAHSIYLATVEGISGANQNNGYGFALSAIAELWNIRGTIGNPYGRTKITNRYRGIGITESMILNVINQYPNGISGNMPDFDSLLGIGTGEEVSDYQQPVSNNGGNQSSSDDGTSFIIVIWMIISAIFKFILGWGWIISLIAGFIGMAVFLSWLSKR